MFATDIENKVVDILQAATIDDVSTDVVQGIEKLLLDWNQIEQFPRLIVVCEDIATTNYQIGGACIKEYGINIYLLCYNTDETELVEQRDTILERVETALRNNQRLDNLADNTNTERVYSSSIDRVRLSKSGIHEGFSAVAWISLLVNTDRNVPI